MVRITLMFIFLVTGYITRKCVTLSCDPSGYRNILSLNLNNAEIYCAPPFTEIRDVKQHIFLIKDNLNNTYIEDCLFMKRSVNNTAIIIISNDETLRICDRKRLFSSSFPNAIIVTNDLNEDVFNRSFFKFIFEFHHNFVFIIITTRNTRFTCNNGVFNGDVMGIMYDYLNFLWHKHEMFYVVMEFPVVCPGFYVIYQGRRPSKHEVYDRTITTIAANDSKKVMKEMRNSWFRLPISYPLRANIFNRFPTSLSNCTNIHYYMSPDNVEYRNGFCGMDAFIMNELLVHFRFNVTFVDVDDSEGYGSIDETGAASGSVRHLLENKFDISFNSRFMVKYLNADEIAYTGYVWFDSVCAVLNDPPEIPLWHYGFDVFKIKTWISLIVTFAFLGLIAIVMNLLRKRIIGKETKISSWIVIEYMMLGMCGFNFNKKVVISVLSATCLIASISMVALFQSHVNYVYTTLVKYDRIGTLAKLLKSNIKIYTSPSLLAMLGDVDKSHFVLEYVNRSNILSWGNIATLQRKSDIELAILLHYVTQGGKPQLYVVNECFSNFYLSYMVREGYSFTVHIERYISRLNEAGLPQVYYRWTKYALGAMSEEYLRSRKTEPRRFFPSPLQEQRFAFGLLLVGYAICTFIFVLEKWWAKRSELYCERDSMR